MISVNNLRRVYGHGTTATHALRGINLEVPEGEFVAVMGRSGSGKSTLLHQLGLLDLPTGGEIRIEGVETVHLAENVRCRFRLEKLGYVFQEYSLIGELTAIENVCLPGLAFLTRRECRRRAEELLDVVGLAERLDHYPSELSGGEQQRVAVARSLVNRPRIIFADEPTASLDGASALMVLDLFRDVNRRFGQTIVMVTHEPEDEKYVDRVVWLKDGLVEKERSRGGLKGWPECEPASRQEVIE
jgi:putative ABC transport system ATP-binding protein